MAVMKRTTGGLLQGEKRTFGPEDFENVIRHLEARVTDESVKRTLGLDIAKQYAAAQPRKVATSEKGKSQIVDLQRTSSRLAR